MMTEKQTRAWNVLCTLSGEDVARAVTNFFGNGQILTDEFMQYIEDEGYCEEGTITMED